MIAAFLSHRWGKNLYVQEGQHHVLNLNVCIAYVSIKLNTYADCVLLKSVIKAFCITMSFCSFLSSEIHPLQARLWQSEMCTKVTETLFSNEHLVKSTYKTTTMSFWF